jgi:DNA repair exonuclease SbcCD ATPase subunit
VDKAGKHDHSLLKLAQANLKDIEQQLQRAQASLAEFNRRAAAARASIDQTQVVMATLQQKVIMLTDQRSSEHDAGNPLSQQLSELRQDIVSRKSELKRRTDDWHAKLSKAHDSEFWVKGFRDIKLNIIEETLDELELTANAMLEQVGLVGWELQFDVERESKSGTLLRGLNVLIQSPYNNDAVKWECWSGGEGQRLRVLGALALGAVLLNRAGVESQLEILDEPGSHISPLGIQDLVDMLAERARLLGRVIFFVDQNVVQSAKFASSITVVRERDGIRCEMRS